MVVHGVVQQVGRQVRLFLDGVPIPGRVGALHVRAVDGLEPRRAAQLRDHFLAGHRVDDGAAAPPALGLERGHDGVGPLLEGDAARRGVGQRFLDGGQQVGVHHLGDGEAAGVFVAHHVPPVEGRPQALAAQEVQRFLGRHVPRAGHRHVQELQDGARDAHARVTAGRAAGPTAG